MKRFVASIFCIAAFTSLAKEPRVPKDYSAIANQIITTATNSDFAFKRLTELCDTFGPRFSGTANLENAIDWALQKMKADGLANVRGEDVMVPHWVRGEESAELIQPRRHNLGMLGLGGSIGTPAEGITAEVLVVKSLDDLKQHASRARGKIVLINQPFTDYHETVLIRTRGAMEAARVGAVASLVRSVTPKSLHTPHTGNMRYTNDVTKIPHAAITVEDAELLQRMQDRGEKIVLSLKMNAQTLPDSPSRNVIAELPGREHPEEVVIVSGHIDSWDVGQGAMDDGGGCLAAWEAVRLLKNLNLHPRRTIRIVLWTNEENGIAGGKAYAEKYKSDLNKHILAIECDDGVFAPRGFAFNGSDTARKNVKQVAALLKRIGADEVVGDAGGADISKLEPEVPIMDLRVDPTKYFWYHHTDADTIDKLDSHELNLCVAAMAVMSYVVADMPESLKE